MQHKIIALVPMKGHSERVFNKNLRSFGGKPLYHHIMKNLLECPYIQDIHINTDSEAIANDVASHFEPGRVCVIGRPQSICGDFVSMNKIIEYDLSQVDGQYFLQTHSTNPLLTKETISRAVEAFFEKREYDSLFGVNQYQSRFYNQFGVAVNHNPKEMLRTQDLPPLFEENSNFYIFSRGSFIKTGRRIGDSPQMFPVTKLESVDIDTEDDFKIAEALYEYFTQAKN